MDWVQRQLVLSLFPKIGGCKSEKAFLKVTDIAQFLLYTTATGNFWGFFL